MIPIIPSPAGQVISVLVPSRPVKPTRLERLFSVLVTVAAASSVLSTLAFVGYLLLPHVTSQLRAYYALLYGVGIVGLVIAEICQMLGVATLIGQWISHTNPQKKPKELAILLLSLIPYMAVVVFLIILVVYLRTRRQDPTSEKTREAAHELKKQAMDTIIDVGAEVSHSEAESSAAPASNQGATQHSNRSSLQQAVSRVVGPSTGKTVSNVAQGFVVFTFVAFLSATVATASAVLPGKGLAPLQSLLATRAVSSEHPKHTHTPAPINSLTRVDWANHAYPSPCPGGGTVTVTNGQGQTSSYMLFKVILPPVYGDLTGDGKPGAALSYGCTGADYFGTRVWVFTGIATAPQLIGDLPDASADTAQGTVGSISKVTISNGVLTLEGEGYSPSAPHCCPDLAVTLVYRWTGTAFTLASEQMTPAQ